MRLFFALWPPVSTARRLAEWADEVRTQSGGRRTAEGNIHLTLAFLGDADPGRASRAARRVRCRAQDLPIQKARYVNKMVWVGPQETPAALSHLHEQLSMELYREEFILERRPFAAHVTLIRDARRVSFPPLPQVEWPVNEFLLVRSSVSSKGATYEPVERFALAG